MLLMRYDEVVSNSTGVGLGAVKMRRWAIIADRIMYHVDRNADAVFQSLYGDSKDWEQLIVPPHDR